MEKKTYEVKQKELTNNVEYTQTIKATDVVTADLDAFEDFIGFLQERVNLKSPMRIETVSIKEVSSIDKANE